MAYTFFVIGTKIGSVAVAAIPKCGQHTLTALGSTELSFDRIEDFPVRMAFIRDPLDRLSSCFHFFLHSNYGIGREHLSSYEAFIDWALNSDDEHVLPQCELFSRYHFKRRFLVSDMNRVLGLLTGEKIPHENAAPRFDIDQEYRLQDIKGRYQEDFDMVSEVLNGLR